MRADLVVKVKLIRFSPNDMRSSMIKNIKIISRHHDKEVKINFDYNFRVIFFKEHWYILNTHKKDKYIIMILIKIIWNELSNLIKLGLCIKKYKFKEIYFYWNYKQVKNWLKFRSYHNNMFNLFSHIPVSFCSLFCHIINIKLSRLNVIHFFTVPKIRNSSSLFL